MKAKGARNAEDAFERAKNQIINNLKYSLLVLRNELKYRKDLDDVLQTYAYNKLTGKTELINITRRDYTKDQIRHLEEKLADTDTIDHSARRTMYRFVRALPSKDNAGHIDSHCLGYMDSRIRVPSLKRKTAWKRFYKMFPELKGRIYITGYSTGGAKRTSFIKLKNI